MRLALTILVAVVVSSLAAYSGWFLFHISAWLPKDSTYSSDRAAGFDGSAAQAICNCRMAAVHLLQGR